MWNEKSKLTRRGRLENEKFVDSLSKEEIREKAIRFENVKGYAIVFGIYTAMLLLVLLLVCCFMAVELSNEQTDDTWKTATIELSKEMCEQHGEEFYTIYKSVGNLIVECEESKYKINIGEVD